MKKIGILGGTFDPVHNGHLGLVAEIQEALHLDRILLVPVHHSLHKQGQFTASFEHRMDMLRLAVGSAPDLEISEVEIKRGETSYTIDTLCALETQYPNKEFNLILGTDTFEDFHSWKNATAIAAKCNLIVGKRPGFAGKSPEQFSKDLFGNGTNTYLPEHQEEKIRIFRHTALKRSLTFIELVPRNISSREIRRKIYNHESPKNMLPPEVEHYIMSHRLYQAESRPDMG